MFLILSAFGIKNCIQDFEALTPNLLARTIETVEGGGLIVLLLRSLSSLTSLYTMVMVGMDVANCKVFCFLFCFVSHLHSLFSSLILFTDFSVSHDLEKNFCCCWLFICEK